MQVNVTPPAACASFAEAALKSASILSFYSPEFNTRGTRRGTPRKPLDQPREQLRNWLIAVPDLTLDQLQQKLGEDCGVQISRAQVARALKRMGLRLKKSHSTPASATGKKTVVGEKTLSNVSARSRRKS